MIEFTNSTLADLRAKFPYARASVIEDMYFSLQASKLWEANYAPQFGVHRIERYLRDGDLGRHLDIELKIDEIYSLKSGRFTVQTRFRSYEKTKGNIDISIRYLRQGGYQCEYFTSAAGIMNYGVLTPEGTDFGWGVLVDWQEIVRAKERGDLSERSGTLIPVPGGAIMLVIPRETLRRNGCIFGDYGCWNHKRNYQIDFDLYIKTNQPTLFLK